MTIYEVMQNKRELLLTAARKTKGDMKMMWLTKARELDSLAKDMDISLAGLKVLNL